MPNLIPPPEFFYKHLNNIPSKINPTGLADPWIYGWYATWRAYNQNSQMMFVKVPIDAKKPFTYTTYYSASDNTMLTNVDVDGVFLDWWGYGYGSTLKYVPDPLGSTGFVLRRTVTAAPDIGIKYVLLNATKDTWTDTKVEQNGKVLFDGGKYLPKNLL